MQAQLFGAFFNGAADNQPQPFDGLPWEAFCELLAQRDARPHKDGAAFSLGRFVGTRGGEALRRKECVTELSGLVLDFDHFEAGATSKQLLDQLEGLAHVAYTTHSHDPENGHEKWRVVLPFAHPLPAASYKAAWAWFVNGLRHVRPDAQPSSVATLFFLPSCPPERQQHAHYIRGEGKPLLLPPLSSFKVGLPPPRLLSTKVDWPWLRERMRTYKRDTELQAAFRAVLKGLPFGNIPGDGQPGNRDSLLTRMCGVLAGWALQCEPEELAEIFRPSLARMTELAPDDPPANMDRTIDKIARAQSSMTVRAETENAAAEPEAAARPVGRPAGQPNAAPQLAGAGAGDPDDPETQARFDRHARDHGFASWDDMKPWLILRNQKASFWVWRDGNDSGWRGPMSESAAESAAFEYWAGFPGVFRYRVKADGNLARRPMKDLQLDYGKVIDKVDGDLCLRRPVLDVERRTYHEAGAPWRPLEPEYDETIDRWLRLLGGERPERLLDWIASVTNLARPSAVLFLRGSKGVGKSLLVRGLARIWDTDQATDAELIFASNFNDALRTCPLVCMEEISSIKGVDITAKLRAVVTTKSRTINAKYEALFALNGYVRVMLTANNFNVFANDKHGLTPEDRDAIAQRFLEVTPSPEAEAFLMSMPFEERNSFAEADRIARHTLWLAANRHIDTHGRFLVEGDEDGALATRMTTHDKRFGSWVTEWLALYLTSPITVEAQGERALVYRNHGRVLVNPEAVINSWARLVRNKQNPQSLEISNALRSLSTGKLLAFPNDSGTQGFEILVDEVANWAQENGIGNVRRIRENAKAAAGESAPAKVLPMQKTV